MNSSREYLTYRAYILRLWQERPASPERPAVWRFSLEETRARRRLGFGDLAALTAFLEAQMETEQGGKGAGERGSRSDKETRRP